MNLNHTSYQPARDFGRVSDFLTSLYQPDNLDGNWLQPIWAYMHSHPALDESMLARIGLWEDRGNIVAVVHYESTLGEAFFEIHPDYRHLKPMLLDYAESQLSTKDEQGRRYLRIYIQDSDTEFEEIAHLSGYALDEENHRPMSIFAISQPAAQSKLPEGFKLQTLEQEHDLQKMDRVLWRGFNHPGEPPADNLIGRRKMESVPGYRRDLKITVAAPDGEWVCFCGFWFDEKNKIALLEPLATDPLYRRMGIAKAAVYEGIQRCAALGATRMFVGSDQPFYLAIGFKPVYTSRCWFKTLTP